MDHAWDYSRSQRLQEKLRCFSANKNLVLFWGFLENIWERRKAVFEGNVGIGLKHGSLF